MNIISKSFGSLKRLPISRSSSSVVVCDRHDNESFISDFDRERRELLLEYEKSLRSCDYYSGPPMEGRKVNSKVVEVGASEVELDFGWKFSGYAELSGMPIGAEIPIKILDIEKTGRFGEETKYISLCQADIKILSAKMKK